MNFINRQTEKMQELVFNALDINSSGTISFRSSTLSIPGEFAETNSIGRQWLFWPMSVYCSDSLSIISVPMRVSIVREWLLAVCICRKGTHDEKLAWTFRLYDTDGSGSIDFEEVKLDPCFIVA